MTNRDLKQGVTEKYLLAKVKKAQLYRVRSRKKFIAIHDGHFISTIYYGHKVKLANNEVGYSFDVKKRICWCGK